MRCILRLISQTPSASLRLTLFGGFDARSTTGAELSLPTRKAQALVAYLAVHGPASTRDSLAGLLWGESGEEQARQSLRQALFSVRKVFESVTPAALVPQGDAVRLNHDAVACDVWQFEEAIRGGSPDALARAISLYRGDLLDGLAVDEAPFEEWLAAERARLREEAIAAHIRLIAHVRSQGSVDEALRIAQRLVAINPLLEAAHRALMELYESAGRRADALRQYDACADVLRRELRVTPEPATIALHYAIRRRGDAGRRRILVVEDEAATRELIVALLADAGYDAVAADDGDAALLQLGAGPFDLIVADVDMPTVDGVTLLEVVARRGLRTPVILITGLTDETLEQRGFSLGAADYMRKPVDAAVLRARVRNALQRFAVGLMFAVLLGGRLLAAPPPTSPQRPAGFDQTVWRVEDGLPSNVVTSIAQASDGYLWIGTFGGAVRFDGVRFTPVTFASGPDNRISHLLADRAGNVWAINEGRRLFRWRAGEVTAYGDAQGLPRAPVNGIAEDATGRVWLATGAGVCALGAGGCRPVDAGLAAPNVDVILPARDGAILAGAGQWLVDVNGSRVRTRRIPGGREITALVETPDGAVWVGTNGGGLYRTTPDAVEDYTERSGVFDQRVASLVAARDGTLWIGMSGRGLLRVEGDAFRPYGTGDGLSDGFVRTVFQDRDENLWVGTNAGGINRLRLHAVTVFTTADGLTGNPILALFEDRRRRFWVGTNCHALDTWRDGRFVRVPAFVGCPFSIADDRDGNVWLGTHGEGVVRLSDAGATAFTVANGLAGHDIWTIAEDAEGTLWFGGDGLTRLSGGRLQAFTARDGFTSRDVRVIHPARSGVWIGTYGDGLIHYAGGRFTSMTTREGLSSNDIRSVHEDADGIVWAGTYGGGLNRIAHGRVVSYRVADGLLDDLVSQLVEDDRGRLWMGGNRGIWYVWRDELNAFAERRTNRITSTAFGRREGLLTVETNGGFQPSAIRSADGRLWFATVNGLASIDPARLHDDIAAPSAVIESVDVDGRAAPTGAAVVIPAGAQRVTIRFTGLSFVASERVRFRYRLDGYDRDWVDAGTTREASYAKLPPGDYTFRVTAQNVYGVWSPAAARLPFAARAFFYQTNVFGFLVAVALAGLAMGGHRYRLQRLARRNVELERRVAERTRDLHDARLRAEDASRAKSEFVANVSHELRTPMNGILTMTELALGADLAPEPRRWISVAKSSADSLLRIIDDLLDFSRIEARRLDLVEEAFDLRAHVSTLIHALQPRAAARGLTLDVTFDDGVPRIVAGDPDRVGQVLINLIGNAVKFTDRGGVTVRVAPEPDDGERVRFSVTDTGPGIPPDKHAAIFEAFTQADGSSARRHGGTGLGLTIAAQLAGLMHLRIWVESDVGAGSTFHASLRLCRAEAQTRGRAANPAPLPASAPLDILVVDDNPVNREVACALLERAGHRASIAATGPEALDLLARARVDVVLMDVQMPAMDGFETTAAIRSRERATGGHVPIVAMTSHAMVGDRERCLAAGMDGYLAKPLGARLLQEALAAVTGRAIEAAGHTSPAAGADGFEGFDAAWLQARAGGSRDVAARLVDVFVRSWPAQLAEVKLAIDGRDAAALRRTAHRLKGAISNFPYPALESHAARLEALGAAGDFAEAAAAYDALADGMRRMMASLAAVHF